MTEQKMCERFEKVIAYILSKTEGVANEVSGYCCFDGIVTKPIKAFELRVPHELGDSIATLLDEVVEGSDCKIITRKVKVPVTNRVVDLALKEGSITVLNYIALYRPSDVISLS